MGQVGLKLQPCTGAGNPNQLVPCGGGSHLLSLCNTPICWAVATVTFAKDPGSISFACRGCAAPGVAVSYFTTSLADGSDRNVLATCVDMPYTICSATFVISVFLSEKGWGAGPVVDDGVHVIYMLIRSGQDAASFNPNNGCPCCCQNGGGDLPELGLARSFGDVPGPSRCKAGFPECTPCDLTYCVTCGGSSHIGHLVPDQPGSGPEGCLPNGSCCP